MAVNGSAQHEGRLRFGAFVFDAGRAELRHAAGGVVPLRPKTWALLAFLLARPGRVAEREAILDAVWPGVTVGDESLSQAVAELRRALGPDGPRLIRTVPRRGYMLEAEVSEDGPAEDEAPPRPLPAGPVLPARRRPTWLAVPVLVLVLVAWWWGATAPTEDAAPVAMAQAGEGGAVRTEPTVPPSSPREVAEALHREGLRIYQDWSACRFRWLEARPLFERAIAADPFFAPAYVHASYSYWNAVWWETSLNSAEDAVAAERLARRAVELAPDHPEAWHALAQALRLQRRHGEALDLHRWAESLGGPAMAARLGMGLALLALGRGEEAVEPLRATLAAEGASSSQHRGSRLHTLGLIELHLGLGDHGAEKIRRSLDLRSWTPVDVRRLHFAAALALSGRVEDARAVAADVRAREPDLGIAYLRAREDSDHPDYVRQREALYRGLALAGVHEGRATVRPATFSRSCVPAPPEPPGSAATAASSPREEAWRLHGLGNQMFWEMGCPGGWLSARPLFQRAIAADPLFAPAHAQMAFTYLNVLRNEWSASPAEDLRAAERFAEQAAATAPELPLAHNARGGVRLLQGRLDEALEAYGRAAALDGAVHPARANVGYLLLLLGRAGEAEAPLRASIALDPQHPFRGDWQSWLGGVDLLLGRNDHGVRHFRAALDQTGTITAEGRRLHLAAALALDGQVGEARALVAEVLAREPGLSIDSFRRIQGSGHPTYLAQRDRLYRGLALAGLPDTSDADTRVVRLSCNQQVAGSR